MDENEGVAKGGLNNCLAHGPVAYLSKTLGPVAMGWPPCLHTMATVILLVKDADKLTLGQELTITAPHAIEGWLSNTA